MAKRPLSITILSLLMIAAGTLGIIYHLSDFNSAHREADFFLLLGFRLLAIVCGAFLLQGHNWARWLTLAWLVFHVVVSAFDSWMKFGMHALLLLIFVIFLFRAGAREFFTSAQA